MEITVHRDVRTIQGSVPYISTQEMQLKLEHFMKSGLIVTILDKICHLCCTIYTFCFNVNTQMNLLNHDLTKTLENNWENAREKVAFMSTFANCHHCGMLCISFNGKLCIY